MSANPFDIKTVLLARHAQHVVLIHYHGRGVRLFRALDKEPHASCGRILQSITGCTFHCARRGHRCCCVAVGAGGPKAARYSVRAPGCRLHLERADQACFLDAPSCAPSATATFAKLPAADRRNRGIAGSVDGASRRISEWRKRARARLATSGGIPPKTLHIAAFRLGFRKFPRTISPCLRIHRVPNRDFSTACAARCAAIPWRS